VISSAVIIATSSGSLLAEQRPRAMLPVLGKPMVVRVMDRLYKAGIRRFIVIVGLNEGPVASYLNKQWMPDAKIEFVLKSTESLHALLCQIASRNDEPFLITGYNSFAHENFFQTLMKAAAEDSDALIISVARSTLTASGAELFSPLVVTDRQQISKTRDVNSAIVGELAVVGRSALEYLRQTKEQIVRLPAGRNLLEIIHSLTAQVNTPLRIVETAWLLCVENELDLFALNKRMLDESNDAHILSELPYSAKIIPPIRIDPQVSVGQSVVIGPYVYVERGSSIGYGAKLKNTIVLERANVPADANLNGCIVTTRGTVKI
jgi:NDP-sugar pyrophosphorylase family protein